LVEKNASATIFIFILRKKEKKLKYKDGIHFVFNLLKVAPTYLQGCQIFLGTTYQNGKIYQITIKYTKWPNRPDGHTI
jgi:hypothetical protein